ncbi:hypothetical protein N476_17225 [Pseudoalteromonas luteoviolacea H33]|uniref:Uncharacterized protein n=2 Tax=Pseudoalteromonas luteoviolacea TaxID=43657 RepID=A0A162AHN7_9GAMM|nr:hypothetical protein N476_17225 [Pseudoalteromonas luteoviolacea H33]KZN76338.1 hypothetical protein N477_16665 [Pseudoalteromonas luteoviolacea H33-S]
MKNLAIFIMGLFTGIFLNILFDTPIQQENMPMIKVEPQRVELIPQEIKCHIKQDVIIPINAKKEGVEGSFYELSNFALKFADEEDIVHFALQQGILDRDSIGQITDVKQAANRLSKIAAGKNGSDEVEMLNHGPSRVYFSNGEQAFAGYANQNEFNAEIKKITATFETGADYGHKVLVKWINTDTQQLLAFKNVSIKSADDLHYVTLSKQQWQSGIYQVEIYAISDDFPLLAKGHYSVSASL